MHISDERNWWGDLVSWCVNVSAVAVRAVVVFASSAPVETMPSKDAIREVQQQTRADLSVMVSGAFFRSLLWLVARRKTTRISFAWDWMVETCYGSRNKRRRYRRGSWCALT